VLFFIFTKKRKKRERVSRTYICSKTSLSSCMFNETFLLGTSSVCAEICIGGRVTGCLTLKKRELARLVLEAKEFLFRNGKINIDGCFVQVTADDNLCDKQFQLTQ
jgi:hypothetical protein